MNNRFSRILLLSAACAAAPGLGLAQSMSMSSNAMSSSDPMVGGAAMYPTKISLQTQ